MPIYILIENQRSGPYTDDDIRTAFAKGEVSCENLAWREGMPDWQPLRMIFPHSAHLIPPPVPTPTPTVGPPKAAPIEFIKAFCGLLIFGLLAWNWIRSSSSNRITSRDNGSLVSTTAKKTVTVGQKQGTYEKIQIRKLESKMLDYGAAKKKVEVTYSLLSVKVEPNYQRLNLWVSPGGDLGANGIDVLVQQNNPLYDQIIDLTLPYNTEVTVCGTVERYSNSFDSIYITPDLLTFSFRKRTAE